MSVNAALLDSVCHALTAGLLQRADMERQLRAAHPGVPFSMCSDNDIPSRLKPLATGEGFALYGLNTSEHCAALTSQLDAADGIVIGIVDNDER